ncbi:zinc-dependent alcohol dehydrogenase family protein [Enterococcus dispar]|jgi:NADPH:quinone reductase-like Zn-dependent oxidoreductase|uniref:zinc-dependent alcohol dehydrogenase family protein n=3 Tax=Enterococcus TaxID=1350 RepID=UPI001E4D865E|nr:zinc-dependent alcohol dehydrogenase family protein [Enterococcus dispar]MDT2704687.1 zinc-dependent alcohol dehydrogenase family protein [Enterococcus dispar]WCG34329.1 zinc-dependent alcohol dehydrogenase family protein [Enterococcus dispar]
MDNQQLYFETFGKPEKVIKLKNRQIAPLMKGEILVEMLYAPINPSDLIPVTGAYSPRTPLPSLLGYEGVGIVRSVKNVADQYLLNKMVLPLRGEGTWQRFVVTQADYAIVVPDEIDLLTASQAYINPVTAWVLCVEEFQLKRGDILVINAANSSIGKSFVQLAKLLGFHLIAIVRHECARKELEKLGAFFVINSTSENVKEKIMQITDGKGVTAAVDSVGGVQGTILATCVKKGGNFRTIGLLSGKQVDWQFLTTELDISVAIFHLRHWLDQISVEHWQRVFETIFYYMKKGLWQLPQPAAHYAITHYAKAIASQKQTQGKIIFDFYPKSN